MKWFEVIKYVVGLVIFLVIVRFLKGLFSKKNDNGLNDYEQKQQDLIDYILANLDRSDGVMDDSGSVNYSESMFVDMAGQLDSCLLSYPWEREDKATEIVLKMREPRDWYRLVEKFGLRTPFGMFRDKVNLVEALKRYLDVDNLTKVQVHLTNIGSKVNV